MSILSSSTSDVFRKNPQYILQYLQIAVKLVETIDEDEQWEQGSFESTEELSESDNVPHVIGLTVCLRLSPHSR